MHYKQQRVDFWIDAIRYDERRGFISHLQVRGVQRGYLKPPRIWSQKQVVNAIKRGYAFWTMYEVNGEIQAGEKVSLYKQYLRTDRSQLVIDNLLSLPRF